MGRAGLGWEGQAELGVDGLVVGKAGWETEGRAWVGKASWAWGGRAGSGTLN